MKVLVSDKLGNAGIKIFEKEEGIDVDVKTDLSPGELMSIIGDYEALVIRSATKVTEELLESAKKLKVICRGGIGLDNVDIPAATKRGIAVMNTPKGNVITTAEHAIAMMMSLTRNIPQGTSSLRAFRWDKKELQGREVFQKTLGVIGFGKIGSIVADRARGLKMNVIVFDPVVSDDMIEKAGCKAVSLDELYGESDYISIHVPKTKKTLGLLNKSAFEKMKEGVLIINCARGGIIDEDDLYEAVKSGKVAGAALDVFATEPPGESRLFELDSIIATPHLGASTREAQRNVAVAVAKQVITYLKEDTAINAVNLSSVSREVLGKLEPFMTLADRMGCLQAQLSNGRIREVTVEYHGDFRGLDMSPATTSVLTGLLGPLASDEVNAINAPVLAKEMGVKVTETSSLESQDYANLITVQVITKTETNNVSGTLLDRQYPRIVNINDFRLEMVPEGNFALIHEESKPGVIRNIAAVLGENAINISRMTVGQHNDAASDTLFLRTDTPLSKDILGKLRSLPMVKSITPFEL